MTETVPLTAALVAVGHAPRCAIVARADDSLSPDNNASHSPLHAVASQSGQICKLHEVLVPAGSKARLVGEV